MRRRWHPPTARARLNRAWRSTVADHLPSARWGSPEDPTLAEELTARAEADLAYLTDRVLSAEGRPQRYGTQFHPVAGQLVPRPIEEADALDERRAAMDLCPFDEYVDSFRRRFR